MTSVRELLECLQIDPSLAKGVDYESLDFGLRVPKEFVQRMKPGDPLDPLLLQVLPLTGESEEVEGYSLQPLQESSFTLGSGLIQKYRGRVLLMVSGACAVHCRYCFRRNFPYHSEHPWGDSGRSALAIIEEDRSLDEVILSGGDPLSASDERLAELVDRLDSIPHLRRLRIHTRLPIVLPSRVDERMTAWMSRTRLDTVVVLHANHAQEVDRSVAEAVSRLSAVGSVVLNQAVLLAGINDSLQAQRDLSHRLFAAGILPYYLHLLDRVQGAAHFEVPETKARVLLQELRETLPGYLVPRLVREEPGAASKVPT